MDHQAATASLAAAKREQPDFAAPAVSVEMVAAIFERVLRISPIEADADFFELGGDSIMATQLAIEIETEFDVKLPVSVLFDAATPATLAHAIERLSLRRTGPMVLLRPGGSAPPLFLAPGTGGLAITIASFAKRMDVPGPIYGFQAPGLDAAEPPLARIEEMAAHYLPALRAIQPHGPYFLGGYSMGGLTALELAQMLVRSGERVALLALFDTYIHPKRLAWHRKLDIWRRRTAHHAGILRRKRWHEAVPYVLGRAPGLLNDIGAMKGPTPGRPRLHQPLLTPAARRVIEGGLQAAALYRPRFYPGTITFFRAKNDSGMETYPDATWRGLARGLEIHELDGDHWNILLARGTGAAQQFSQCVRLALAAAETLAPPARPDHAQQ